MSVEDVSQGIATVIIVDYADGSPDSFEEARMQSHFGVRGPVAVVYEWLGSIGSGDFETAWMLMDPSLRLCRAQAWLWNNRRTSDVESLNQGRFMHGVRAPRGARWNGSAIWV